MTAAAPLDQDERPPQMSNDSLRTGAVVLGVWTTLAGLLWMTLREDGDAHAAGLAAVIVMAAAATSHATIAVADLRRIGPWRWPLTVGTVVILASLSHVVFSRLGMVQSLTQDIINMAVISGVALSINHGWSGRRARQSLAGEAARRATAEARLAQQRLRPSALVAVKVGHGERMINPVEISYVQADRNFTILHDEAGPIYVSESLKAITERLTPFGFVRVHKSHAVNSEAICERRYDAITLKGGVVLAVGRAYRI